LFLLLSGTAALAQVPGKYDAIYSGVPLFDDRGKEVSAHGGSIVKEGNTYYLFGEAHIDGTNAFSGFNAYSSKDLYNWKFEGEALAVQSAGPLGPARVGERPKVMKSPQTGEYVMYMHVDALDYRDQYVGYATASNIAGPYTFHGPLLFDGRPIRKWDMGTFQDHDGAGYVLLHGGDIYRLADDFKHIASHVSQAFAHGFESPALFRDGDTYYFLGSNLTGWERNDNYYYSAKNLAGPWEKRGPIAPAGTLTWNSQVTFVLAVEGSRGTTYMFMGDRWSFPRQATAATYVWQPLTVTGGAISMPYYHAAWTIDTATALRGPASFPILNESKLDPAGSQTIDNLDDRVHYTSHWRQVAGLASHHVTSTRGAALSLRFVGTQAAMYGVATDDSGYACIELRDSTGKKVLTSVVDMYSQYTSPTIKFVTPLLPRDMYTLTMTAMGENWYWLNKRKERSGSKGYAVSFDKLIVR